MQPSRRVAPGLATIALMLWACGGTSAGSTTSLQQSLTESEPSIPTTSQPVETVPNDQPNTTNVDAGGGTGTTGPSSGEGVPSAVLAAVVADAARQVSATSSQLEVVRAEAVAWSDGSLGCPQPGLLYTQAIVPGFWVQIQAPDKFLDYRVDGQGNFTLCADVVAPSDQSGGVAPHPTIPPPETGDAPSY